MADRFDPMTEAQIREAEIRITEILDDCGVPPSRAIRDRVRLRATSELPKWSRMISSGPRATEAALREAAKRWSR